MLIVITYERYMHHSKNYSDHSFPSFCSLPILWPLEQYHYQSITVSSNRASRFAQLSTTIKTPSLKLAKHEPAGFVLPVLTPYQPRSSSLLVFVHSFVLWTVNMSSLKNLHRYSLQLDSSLNLAFFQQ